MLPTMNEFYPDGGYVSAGQCFVSYFKENAKFFQKERILIFYNGLVTLRVLFQLKICSLLSKEG